MNLATLRTVPSKLLVALVASSTLLLSACGGGGASTPNNASGALQLLPGSGSLYAGVPYTFTIAGGRAPFTVTSSEQTLLPLGFTVTGTQFQATPFNPGVIDSGLQAGEVPRRSVNIEVRDSVGTSVLNTFSVLQNFFTGYGEFYQNTCTQPATGAVQACSGQDTVLTLTPVSQGALYGNRELQFDKVRGDFQFVVEDPNATPQLVNQLRYRTDQNGIARARMRMTVAAPTQIASYKVTDIQTGTTTDYTFVIVQQAPSAVITLLPTTLTFTGALSTQCGSGSGSVFVFGGTPPYTATTTLPGILVSPTTLTTQGGSFNVNVPAGLSTCPSGSVIITDALGARATVAVASNPGTGTPPPLTVSPATMTLTCAANVGSAAVVGGASGFGLNAISSHPRVTAFISGNTLTVTRLLADGATGPFATTATIAITDGASIANLAATVPASCP